MPHKKITNIILAISSIIFTLIVIELILRNTIIPVPKKSSYFDKDTFIRDNILGYRLRPNQRTVMSDGYFNEEIITNKDGLRDIYNYSYKDLGLVAIGDSYTFGDGVNDKDTWVEQLQDKLKVNIINAGVPGYAPPQYKYLLGRMRENGYPVKLVLYAMPFNDVAAYASIVTGGNVDKKPSLSKPENENAVQRKLGFSEEIQYNTAMVKSYQEFALGRLLYNGACEIASCLNIKTTPNLDRQLSLDIESTKKEISAMAKMLNQFGAKLIIVYIGDITFAMPDKWQRYQKRHSYSRYIIQDSFRSWAESKGIYFEDAVGELEKEYVKNGKKRTSIALEPDNHYNKNGYKVIADVFYRVINENKLVHKSVVLPKVEKSQ